MASLFKRLQTNILRKLKLYRLSFPTILKLKMNRLWFTTVPKLKMDRRLSRFQMNVDRKLKMNRLFFTKNKMMIYSSGILLSTGFCVSSITLNNYNTIIAAYTNKENINDHFHLLDSLRKLAPTIDAEGMLRGFLNELKHTEQGKDGEVSSEFVKQFFVNFGIDEELISRLIEIIMILNMDWDRDDKLSKYQVAALFALFNSGSDIQRYRFLFHCLDLDETGTVNKDEFREIMRCLLAAKYHMYGLENPRDADEIYTDIGVDEYHTMAKFAANQLVRKIFIFADQSRRGKLNWTQFLHWCKRGGSEVKVLKELLYQTHDESFSSEQIHPYKVGHIRMHSTPIHKI